MRPYLLASLFLLALVGQRSAAEPPEVAPREPTGAPFVGDAPAAAILKEVDPESHPWRADLIVGLPLSLRIQRQLTGPLWMEVGVSVYIVVPAAYAGLRLDIPFASGKADSFHVRPGLGFGVTGTNSFDSWLNGGSVTWAIGDVDFVWRHHWSERMSGEFGIKLGVIAPLNVHDTFPLPRAALIFGVQF